MGDAPREPPDLDEIALAILRVWRRVGKCLVPGVPYEELQSGSTHPVTMTPYHLDPQAIEAQIRLIERDGPLLVGMDELDDCLTAMFGSSATGEVIYQVPEWLQKKLDEDPGWMENEPARLGLLD